MARIYRGMEATGQDRPCPNNRHDYCKWMPGWLRCWRCGKMKADGQ
jgi:hypothetical protein